MKLLWRLSREAKRYKGLYLAAILATLALTGVNLAVPKLLSAVTDVVEGGVDEAELLRIVRLTAGLTVLYLLRVLPAPYCVNRRSSCLTRLPPRWTWKRSARSSSPLQGCRASAPLSLSPTDFPPYAAQIRYSSLRRVASSSRGLMTSCWRWAGGMPA